jgi:hypothetical protein
MEERYHDVHTPGRDPFDHFKYGEFTVEAGRRKQEQERERERAEELAEELAEEQAEAAYWEGQQRAAEEAGGGGGERSAAAYAEAREENERRTMQRRTEQERVSLVDLLWNGTGVQADNDALWHAARELSISEFSRWRQVRELLYTTIAVAHD